MSRQDLRSGFLDPPLAAAPMLRWWWFGPTVERAELDRELAAMAAAGFGGVEVAYVYPLEATRTPFLSPEFLADLRFAAERAAALGLRFDLTLGSGWSFGGPHIDAALAARKLVWERREIQPGAITVPVTQRWPGDELVAAFVGAGSLQEPPDAVERLPVEDGQLHVPAGDGTRVVLLAWSQLTGQNVKRAAVGAEGPVLDHYGAAAVDAHLRAVGDRLLDAVPAELVGSVFCDSLEAYEADWTSALPAEFTRRRGYDPLPVLASLVLDLPGATEVRADLHRTLVELYEENFVARIRSWAAGRGVPFRIQGYGSPPATLSSYRFADLFEGEGVGWLEVTPSRWAASAAHLYRRPVVSAEAWTWVHSPSFRATPLDLAAEAHDHLLNGINLLIGHGWPYSPSDAEGIGWAFYAAGALDDRNPWWAAAPGLTAYLRRLSWLQQQGEPVADVALYVPTEDLLAAMGPARGGSLDTWREANRVLAPLARAIRTAGLDYDLVDDHAIGLGAAADHPVVVLPPGASLPEATQERLADHPAVVRTDPNGIEDLGAQLRTIVPPDLEAGADDIGFVHRRHVDADTYLVVNTGPERRAVAVAPRVRRRRVEIWDPRSDRVLAAADPERVPLELHPYQAVLLVLTDEEGEPTPARGTDLAQVELDDDWEVEFPGTPAREVAVPHVWEDEPATRHHSGVATYRTGLDLDALEPGTTVELDLGECTRRPARTDADGMVGRSFRVEVTGPVGEVAEVRVNGISCGVVWAPPYVIDVSAAVRAGRNRLELTVANTAANALAVETRLPELARRSEQRHGRRFRMQDLSRSMATVRSGLLQVPTILVRSAGTSPPDSRGTHA